MDPRHTRPPRSLSRGGYDRESLVQGHHLGLRPLLWGYATPLGLEHHAALLLEHHAALRPEGVLLEHRAALRPEGVLLEHHAALRPEDVLLVRHAGHRWGGSYSSSVSD